LKADLSRPRSAISGGASKAIRLTAELAATTSTSVDDEVFGTPADSESAVGRVAPSATGAAGTADGLGLASVPN